ncbi:MAG: type II 3-dehydroquinate dehydratase [candidate division Zixibacteria bacterium RBG_16_48_11]|nr:MAG: type II 3-dehydroquinate dehydratase [candidate division Zixibacteria bacterium RBG_16_48_11]
MLKILVIHGPNLNLLGTREPDIYGKLTLAQINELLQKQAKTNKVGLKTYQTNSESEIISLLQQAKGKFDGIIINPAAFTHYSLAIYDTILAIGIPTLEVHLSNIYKREEFRRKSVIAPACVGQISGFGYRSYLLALTALLDILKDKK